MRRCADPHCEKLVVGRNEGEQGGRLCNAVKRSPPTAFLLASRNEEN